MRVVLASAVTLAALPALWLVNRNDETAAPAVAAVGLDTDSAPATAASTTMPDVMGSLPPRFLTGTNGSRPQQANAPVAVGQEDGSRVGTGTATYRRDVAGPGLCLSDAVEAGLQVTVINIDNGRSILCTTQPRNDPTALPDEVVLLTTDFAQLADLTDAPINIEIRQ